MQIMLGSYNLYPLLLITGGSLFLTVGDIVAKAWVQTDKPLAYVLTLGLYLAGLVFLTLSFRYKNIAIASMLLIILNIVTLTLWSWIVYGETLNKIQITGLILGLTATLLLEYNGAEIG